MPLTQVNPGLLDTQAQYTGFKNRIINGAMQIWQRGTSQSTANYGSVDRFAFDNAGTYSRSTDVPSGFQYSLSVSVTTATRFGAMKQNIESLNCIDLAGQNVTVSFWMKTTSGSTTMRCNLYYATTTDSFSSSVTNIGSNTFTSSGTWTRYSFTFTNLPSGAVNGLQVYIYSDDNVVTPTYLITGVQLEKGSTATAFDYRPYGTELALCQRYYWKTFVVDTAPAQNVAPGNQIFNICTNNASNGLYFPVSMRATPTITTFNPYALNSSFRVPNSSTDVAVTPTEISASGIVYFSMTRTAPSALHGHITASAEL